MQKGTTRNYKIGFPKHMWGGSWIV